MLDTPSATSRIVELLENPRTRRFHSPVRRPFGRNAVTGFRQSGNFTGPAVPTIRFVLGHILRRQRRFDGSAGARFRSSVRWTNRSRTVSILSGISI